MQQQQRESFHKVALYRISMLAISGAFLLTGPGPSPSAAMGWGLLVVVAVLFTALQWLADGPVVPVLIGAEGLVAATIVALFAPEASALALYLVVPAIWAGTTMTTVPAVLVGSLGGLTLAASSLLLDGPAASTVAWLLVQVGVSFVVCRLAAVEASRRGSEYDYDRALSLMRQLAPITRRLPLGLERSSVVRQAAREIETRHANVSVTIYTVVDGAWIQEAGVMPPPAAAPGSLAWDEAIRNGRFALERSRREGLSWALIPMRRGQAVVGVLVITSASPIGRRELTDYERTASLLALQLEASTLFATIREDATSEERLRMSRQIHDGVAQDLAGLAYILDGMAADSHDAGQGEVIALASSEVRRLVEELRFSIFDLRTGVHSEESLGTALAAYVQQVGDRGGMRVRMEIDDWSGSLDPGPSAELLRIAQEAVTNARRHSGATSLWVTLRVDREAILLQVSDNGVGVQRKGRAKPGSGVGMSILRERSERIGADLVVRHRNGGGTVVECTLPISQKTVRPAVDEPQEDLVASMPTRTRASAAPVRRMLLATLRPHSTMGWVS